MNARAPITPPGTHCTYWPYETLQWVIRVEVDEATWAKLHLTKSRPFDRPETGKIAVKVINHYGDEVLTVFRSCTKTKTLIFL